MDIRKPAALAIIAIVALVVVFVMIVAVGTWRQRTNQTVNNQPPATQKGMVP